MSLILVINPGSTSTKIAIYDNLEKIFVNSIKHSSESISKYPKISDQIQFRKEAIYSTLSDNKISISEISIVVGRGGLLRPIKSGIYEVNQNMLDDLLNARRGEHASNLGAIIANDIAKEANCKAIIADPVVVDEMIPIAKITGHPLFERKSIFHALNQKAIAKLFAKEQKRSYTDLNLIVAHLGGGVSVGAHCKGNVIDVNNALEGDGPFSPERSGGLTSLDVASLCFSGKYTFEQVKRMFIGEGGIVAHLGTNGYEEVEKRSLSGDQKALTIADAFAYNISKAITAMSTPLKGKVDAILLTGGIAYNPDLMRKIKEYVSFLAPIYIYPGEDEMGALAECGYNVLNNIEELKVY